MNSEFLQKNIIFIKFRDIVNDAENVDINKLHNFIKIYKTPLSHELKKNIVCKISCKNYATYAGQTCRKYK